MKTRKFKLVEISWVDAEAEAGWTEDDPHKAPVVFKSYGILVRQDAAYVVHASTFDPETNRWSERSKIPAGMVVGVRELQEIEIELPE
jgi:hypothetical protein